MQIIYTGPEGREFGGKVGDVKFRVPEAGLKDENGQPLDRVVEFVLTDDEGHERRSKEVKQDVGNVLLGVTGAVPAGQEAAKPLYAELVKVATLQDMPKDATPPDVVQPVKNEQNDAPKRRG